MESKKILIITTMMVVIMLSFSTIVEAVNIGEKLSIYGKLGDVNRDGKINSTDTNMIIQYSAGNKYLTILQRKRADVNQDNKINSADSLLIMKYISNNKPIVKPTKIEISGSTEVEVDKTIQLTAKVKPDNTTDKTVTWTSSNTSRATVDTNGNVKGIKEGTVRITAKCGDKSSYININVKPKPVINVTSLTLTGENQVEVGKTIQLTATVRPNNATDKTVTWSSSNNQIATVNNGVVKGEKEGTVTITARCNGVSPQTLTITVNKSKVSLKDKTAVKVKEVDAKPANVKVNDNKTFWNVLYHGDPTTVNVNMNSNRDYKCSGAIALYYANKILGMNPSTSLITTTYVNSKNKTETNFPGGGYLYNDRCLTYDNQINIIYDEILKGNPVPVKVKNSDGDAIYVLAYAVKINAANNGKVLASDIAVIDTKTGSYGKCLDAYYQFSPDTFVVATRDPNYKPIKQIEGMNLYNADGTINKTKINELGKYLTNIVNNPDKYPFAVNRFAHKQCTWWAYTRASQFLGKRYPSLKSSGNNGSTWYGTNKKLGYFNYGSTPKPNSIVVWPYTDKGNAAGHVGYVEAVDTVNKKMYVSHAGGGTKWYGVKEMSYNKKIGGYGPTGFIYLDEPLKNF